MKVLKLLLFFVFSINCIADEPREWTSMDGSQSFSAVYIRIMGEDVLLKGEKNRQVKVPISKLSVKDQEYLYSTEKSRALEPAEDQIGGLNYKKGEIIGPINAGNDSSYMLYVPNSMATDREVPLLLYTSPVGGRERQIRNLVEGAELNGWIVALAMESKNDNATDRNQEISNSIVEHILKSTPTDKKRLYFTGESGGGAMSFYNGDKWNACGLIPMIGYIPSSINAPSCDCVIINGGNDFNRYTSANARKRIGDRAVHRFHEKGHAAAPDWMMHDSMAWLEGRYLAQNPKDNEREMSTYFYSMLDWIEVLKKSNPHRAYYWALFLESEFKLNYLQRMKLDPIIEELGADEKNRLYVEGLNELDQLSLSELAGVTDGSKMDYTDSSLAAACQPLMIKYAGTPYIPEVLEALCRETGNLNPKKRK